jgi:hypothetical protein
MDRRAALFAMWGFTNNFIQGQTGLSHSQISYRLKKLGMQRVRYEYRNGEGEVATALMDQRMRIARPILAPRLEAAMAPKPAKKG